MSWGKLRKELAPQQVLISLTQRHLALFRVPHFSDAFRGAQEEEEEEAAAAEGVPSGFVLPVQGMFEKCWIRSCRAPV